MSIECAECGNAAPRTGRRQRYCGHRCQQRAYRRARRAEVAAWKAEWRRRNPEALLAQTRRTRAAHPERNGGYVNRRNALRAGASGRHTEQEWQEKVALFGGCCAYCGEAKPLTRDHDVPLSRGGSDAIANIIPACLACNSRKRTRTAAEYLGAAA